MEDTISSPEAGTDTGLDGSGSGDAGHQSDLGGSENLQGEQQAEEGRKRGPDGKFGKAQSSQPAPQRSLEDLTSIEPQDWTVEERRKIIKAGKHGIGTEADFEAKFGKAKTAGPLELVDGKPISGQPPKGAKPVEGKPATPVVDLSFLKEVLPTLDLSKPEVVAKSIRELQSHATKASQRAGELERAYPEIEAGIAERLKRGPDGLKEIYSAMGVEIPAWLGGNPQATQQGNPQDTQDLLAGLKDDDFVPASAVKGMVGKLVSQAVAAALAKVDEKYAPLQQSHKSIQERIAKDAEETKRNETRRAALNDVQIHSDFWGEYHPEERLTEKAEKIWAESVGPDGALLSRPHAEWPKLEAILKHRRDEYLDKGHKASSYEHYLYERFHKSGKAGELFKSAAQRAQEALLAKQQRRVQPAMVPGGVGGSGLQGLKQPRSLEDIEKMTPEQRRGWKKLAMSGKLAVE